MRSPSCHANGPVWHPDKRNLLRFNDTERCSVWQGGGERQWSTAADRRRRRRKRADARRNEAALLDAAAAAFVASGVDAPVRDIAARRASGSARSTATSRRAPTSSSPSTATRSRRAPRPVRPCWPQRLTARAPWRRWIDLFVDFLVTKHGLAAALQSDNAAFEALHAYFLDRLCRCAPTARRRRRGRRDPPRRGGLRADARRRQPLHRRGARPRYDARRMVGLLVAGLRVQAGASPLPGPTRLTNRCLQ